MTYFELKHLKTFLSFHQFATNNKLIMIWTIRFIKILIICQRNHEILINNLEGISKGCMIEILPDCPSYI